MSKSVIEIVDEYCKKDQYYNSLSDEEKMLDRIVVRASLDFQMYLLKTRIKECLYLLFSGGKSDDNRGGNSK